MQYVTDLQEVFMSQKRVRESTFELMRIIAMLLIVIYHGTKFTGNGSNYLFLHHQGTISYYVGLFFTLFGGLGTWLYIIITCWFSVDKVKFSGERLVKTLWQTWTVCLLCLIIQFVFFRDSFSLLTAARQLSTPFVDNVHYWYVSAYVLFLLILPILQTVTVQMDNNKLLFTAIVFLVCSPLHKLINTTTLGTLGLFVAAFFMTAWLKRHEGSFFSRKTGLCVTLMIAAYILVVLASVLASPRFLNREALFIKVYQRLRDYNIIQLFFAYIVFFALKKCRLGEVKIINTLSKFSFGVYLWHYNYAFRQVIWRDFAHIDKWYESKLGYLPALLGTAVLAYLIISLIEMVRMKLLDQWLYEKLPWNKKLSSWIDRIYCWKSNEVLK